MRSHEPTPPESRRAVNSEFWTCDCHYMNQGVLCTHCGALNPTVAVARERRDDRLRAEGFAAGLACGFIIGAGLATLIMVLQ